MASTRECVRRCVSVRYGCTTLTAGHCIIRHGSRADRGHRGYCNNQRGLHREKPRRRCLSDRGWNADGVASGFSFFFLIFLLAFGKDVRKIV